VLVTIGKSLGHTLSSSEQELLTSLTSGGALVGAVIAGLMADKYGRKLPIWLACVVFVIGTVLQTAAYGVPQFAVGRFVVGLGVGSAAMIVPLYISELAPAKYRGRMIAFVSRRILSFNSIYWTNMAIANRTTCLSPSVSSSHLPLAPDLHKSVGRVRKRGELRSVSVLYQPLHSDACFSCAQRVPDNWSPMAEQIRPAWF